MRQASKRVSGEPEGDAGRIHTITSPTPRSTQSLPIGVKMLIPPCRCPPAGASSAPAR